MGAMIMLRCATCGDCFNRWKYAHVHEGICLDPKIIEYEHEDMEVQQ